MSVKNNNKVRVSINSKKALESICKWCGKPFNKKYPNHRYCCDDCSKYAELESTNNRVYKHRKNFKIVQSMDKRFGLGSGGLSAHRQENFENELKYVQNEKRRLGVKIFK